MTNNIIRTYPMNSSTILRINSEREIINKEPDYQRRGEIWNIEKRQLLIDSILNDYDLPKLYFHVLNDKQKRQNKYNYAIIDGRQRLETIWKFIDGEFALAEEFIFYQDENVKAGNMTYPDLSIKYPRLKIIFDSFILPIICIETNDLELIDDMFCRLNEAVPLNAAERRNAIGGPMSKLIRDVSAHTFFKNKVKFTNRRYQHREVACRLLFIIHSLKYNNRIIDTKKVFLDEFVKLYKNNKRLSAKNIGFEVISILDKMADIFQDEDELLRSQATIPIYFLLFQKAIENSVIHQINREQFILFRKLLEDNREIAADDLTQANFDFLEYDRMSQQGTNDASSIRERLRILDDFIDYQLTWHD